jgi:hypothetical protein
MVVTILVLIDLHQLLLVNITSIGLVQRTSDFNASRLLAVIRKNGSNAIQFEMGNGGNY